ncbi:MAG: TatD family hydrolase [Minisyncoccales bacterium]
MIFDTHAHINFKAFNKDREKIIKKTLEKGVGMINVGSNLKTSKKAIEIANKFDNVYATVGIHPIHIKDDTVLKENEIRELAEEKQVVAMGEIGLDYYKIPTEKIKEKQKNFLKKQIKIAEKTDLPVVLHCRQAHSEMIDLLSNINIKGVIHCFSGDWSTAQKYLEFGFYLGFNGIIYKNQYSKEVIKKIPLSKMLVETDCPFLLPPEEEGRNEPLNVKYIIKTIAKIKDIKKKEVEKETTKNAQKLFKLPHH